MQLLSFLILSVVIGAAIADRVYYYDLPVQSTTSTWAAGSTVNFVMCWSKGLKWPHNMGKSEWKILLNRRFRKSIEIEPTFTPFQQVVPPNSDGFFGTEKGRYFYGGKDTAPKCNVVTMVIPAETKTSGNYRIQLVRVRHGWFDRKYDKSAKLYIQGKKKNTGKQLDPHYYPPYLDAAKKPSDSVSSLTLSKETGELVDDADLFPRESGESPTVPSSPFQNK